MYYTRRITFFTVIFSVFFSTIRLIDGGGVIKLQLQDLAGLPWLFSVIGLIFSILAGFIIQKQWDNWQNLHDVLLNEVSALNRIWVMTKYFSKEEEHVIQILLRNYITHVLTFEWNQNVSSAHIEKGHDYIFEMRDIVITAIKNTSITEYSLDLVSLLFESRLKRVLLVSHRLPIVLKNLIVFNTSVLIILSMFIGVKSFFFDYLFTLSIGILVYAVYLIIKDLSEVTSSGSWHVQPTQFQQLLERFNKESLS